VPGAWHPTGLHLRVFFLPERAGVIAKLSARVYGRKAAMFRYGSLSSALGLAAILASAGTAVAQTTFAPSVRGAGKIAATGNSTVLQSYECASTQQDDRVTVPCAEVSISTGGSDEVMEISATPSSTPAGHWGFAGWLDCPSPAGEVCTMQVPGIGTAEHRPVALFDDSVAPRTAILAQTIADRMSSVSFSFDESAVAECSLDGTAFAPCTSPVQHGQLADGRHAVRVRGVDASGNIGAPEESAFTILAPLVDLDLDDDGFVPPRDCNDTDPRINPDAFDDPGDRVDEDCVDGPALKSIRAQVVSYWRTLAGRTTVLRLVVIRVPRGASVQVRCDGRGCPFKRAKPRVRRHRANATRLFNGALLRPGSVIDVRITAPMSVGKVVRYKTRRRKQLPSKQILCLRPGERRPTACAA
jgi:hypothetical protein